MEEKGITITFRGDTVEFDRSLDGVNKALKTLKSEMTSINKQLRIDPKNVDLLKQKVANLNQQQKVLTEQIGQYKEALKDIDKNDVGGKEWDALQKKIAKAQSELDSVNKQLDVWGKANLDMVAFGKGLQDASKKTKELANDLKGISMVGTAVATSLTAITVSAGKQADEINTLAKQYNLTTGEIQKFQMAADLIDVDLNTITKSYAKLTKNMTSTSSDVQNAFNTLGVAVRDSNGELRDSGDVFNELISALGNVANETEQDNLAMQIFGKSAAELGPLINGGAEQLEQFNKYLEENGLLLSQDELDALNDMNDALDTIKATFKGLTNSIAKSLAPMFQSALEKINTVILNLKNAWDSLSPSVQKAIPIIAGIVGTASPLLAVVSKLQGSLGGLIEKIGFGNSGLGAILSKVVSPIGIVLTTLGVLYATNEDFRNSVNGLVQQISSMLMPIVQSVGNFLQTYILPAVSNLVNAILPVLSSILTLIIGIISKIVEWIGKLWQYLENRGIIALFADAFRNVGQVIQNIVGFVKDLFGWFGNLINRAKEFLGINGQVQTVAPLTDGRGVAVNYGSGGYASGGFGITMNNTINVSNGNNITASTVLGWADLMTQRINDNLGRMV